MTYRQSIAVGFVVFVFVLANVFYLSRRMYANDCRKADGTQATMMSPCRDRVTGIVLF